MRLLIASPLDPGALEALQRQHDVVCRIGASEADLCDAITDRDVLVFRSGVNISRAVLGAAASLRLLIRAGSGLDNIDLDTVRLRGIRLERIPEPGAVAVAELAFALMLALARKVLVADRLLREGRWAKTEMTGHMLRGKTLGIIGAGNIGARVGEMGVAWGMEAIGCVETPEVGEAARLADRGIQLMPFDEVIARSDFLSVHVPLQPSTRHLINAATLARMKPGAFLINLARGGVADEDALYSALTSGRLAGAALDVHAREGAAFESRLAALENVVLTPHIGANTFDSQRQIGERVIEILNTEDARPILPDTGALLAEEAREEYALEASLAASSRV